jgi:cobalt/nickel transport system permease protein
VKTPSLPEWYFAPDQSASYPARAGSRFSMPVRKTLTVLAEALAQELSSPLQDVSWLNRIEPRAKIIGVFILVFGASLLQNLGPLSALFAVVLIAAFSAGIPARRLGRVWLGAPLFSLAIILPATLNLITPGPELLTLWHIGPGVKLGSWNVPEAISITYSGLFVAARFMLRTVDCISLVFLLIASTDPAVLVNAFRRLGVPRVFGMVLTMCQRYLVTLLRAAEDIHLAKLSRTISSNSLRKEQHWVAAGIGILFRKSYRLAQEVQNAMISRGYDGDFQVGHAPAARLSDGAWTAGAAAIAALLIIYDRWL